MARSCPQQVMSIETVAMGASGDRDGSSFSLYRLLLFWGYFWKMSILEKHHWPTKTAFRMLYGFTTYFNTVLLSDINNVVNWPRYCIQNIHNDLSTWIWIWKPIRPLLTNSIKGGMHEYCKMGNVAPNLSGKNEANWKFLIKHTWRYGNVS